MCSAPKAPKAPKIEKPYEFTAYENDPEFRAMQSRMGIKSGKLSSNKVARIKANMQAEEFYRRYTTNEEFKTAADYMKEQGRVNWEFKQDKEGGFMRTHRNQVSSWQMNEIIDRMNEVRQQNFQQEQDASYREWQEQVNLDAEEFQKELSESMKMPTQRQAAVAPVQAPQPDIKPMPQAPGQFQPDQLPSAPAPTLVNTGDRGGLIKSQSARGQRTQATRGTSSLRIPRRKSSSTRRSGGGNAIKAIGLNIPT